MKLGQKDNNASTLSNIYITNVPHVHVMAASTLRPTVKPHQLQCQRPRRLVGIVEGNPPVLPTATRGSSRLNETVW